MLALLKRYYYTLKYLRSIQIIYRLYYFIHRPRLRSTPVLARNPGLLPWTAPRYIASRLSSEGMFTCLNVSASLADPRIWNHPGSNKLWLYHVHYFDALNAVDADAIQSQLCGYINQWLQHNPPAQGVGWEPYPISVRLVNWIVWLMRTQIEPEPDWLASMIQQGNRLMQRLEYHLLGNHLWMNAKALIFLGCYFSGTEAQAWLQKGLKLLDRELPEQSLPDGGHFELSPMYHALFLWDIADILTLTKISAQPDLQLRKAWLTSVLIKGSEWLAHMSHPDGDIAFFNDATLNAAPKLDAILAYQAFLDLPTYGAAPQHFQIQNLSASGYIVVYLPDNGKCILDVGEVGPSYQPGHAHADTLSCELSLFGQRIWVNSGISEYAVSSMRHTQRGTQAHNTVTINGKNSSEVWAAFRVGHRAYPQSLMIQEQEPYQIYCAHNGYKRLFSRTLHARKWSFSEQSIHIVDTIQGNHQYAEARFYLHPAVKMVQVTPEEWRGEILNSRWIKMFFAGAKRIQLLSTHWYPGFGMTVENQCLVVTFANHQLKTTLTW